jgi:T4 RnlA family RNA ligase
MLKVQEFLINKGKAALADEPYNITIKEYPDDGIMSVNYSQINSPKHDPIIKECRGLILTNTAPYSVVARSFDRFFNLGEDPDSKNWYDKIKNDHVVCFKKHDGSLINLYHFNDKWNCATRKMCFAEGKSSAGFRTFADIFFGVFNTEKMNDIVLDNFKATEHTFIFELVSPETRVVTPYPKDDIYLLSVRNNKTGKEVDFETLQMVSYCIDVNICEFFDFNNIESIENAINMLDALEEGFVLCDYSDMSRIKMKNASYLAIAHLRDNGVISAKRIAHLVYANDYEEYLSYFPEDKYLFDPYIKAYNKMISLINDVYNKYKNIENQKEFALAINKYPFKGVLFTVRAKGISIQDAIDKLTMNSKLMLIESFLSN